MHIQNPTLPLSSPPAAAFRPVFIVGCERSGTTVLAVLLDRHSQLAITPETHFLLRMLGSPPRPVHRSCSHADLLDRFLDAERTRDLALDREKILARFQQKPATTKALFQSLLEEYAAANHKLRVGEKTPFHLWYVPRIVEWFPEARVICIVRDGRDVVRSILKAPWTAQRLLRPHCLTWVQGVRAAEKFTAQFPNHFKLVRFEDLLTLPEKTLHAVDDFLGLPYEPAQLATPEQPATAVVPAWESDWKAKALEPLDPSRIGDWKRNSTPSERLILNSMMRKELARLGYSDTQLPPFSLPRRLWEGLLNTLCRARLYRLYFNIIGRYTPSTLAHRKAGESKAEPQS